MYLHSSIDLFICAFIRLFISTSIRSFIFSFHWSCLNFKPFRKFSSKIQKLELKILYSEEFRGEIDSLF